MEGKKSEYRKRLELKRFVRELSQIKGRHTELVSVYIPAGYDINKIISHLAQEQGTAKNIKDQRTRNNVIDSLEKIIRHLRLFKKTPENGLAVFAGNCSDNESKIDIKVWSIEPLEPLNTRMYRCDQAFELAILEEMLDIKEVYGLIVLDRREANIGILKGTRIYETTKMTSGVPGKTRAGGQCLHPDTAVELADGQNIPLGDVEIGDELKSYDFDNKKFISSEVLDVWHTEKNEIYWIKAEEEIGASNDHKFFTTKGEKVASELNEDDILINGDGKEAKIERIKLVEKKIQMIDIAVKNQNFVANNLVVHNSAQRFERLREGAAKEFYNRVGEACNKQFLEMKDLKGILIGGPGPTKEEFLDGHYLNNELKRKVLGVKDLGYTGEYGLQELVERSQDLLKEQEAIAERQIMTEFFNRIKKENSKVTYGKEKVMNALEMGAVEVLLLSEDMDDYEIMGLEDKAEEYGTEVKIISTDSTEGQQLQKIGGIGALLRYAIE